MCTAMLAKMCSGLAGPTGLAWHLHQKAGSTLALEEHTALTALAPS